MTLDKMDLHEGQIANFNLGFDPPKLNITLRNVTVTDGWIEGDVEASASAFGADLPQQTGHFKTKDNVEQTIDLVAGVKLHLTVRLADPHKVCGSATLEWGPAHLSSGEQCVAI